MTANSNTLTADGRAPRAAGRAEFHVLVADAISDDGLEPLRMDPRFLITRQPGLSGEELGLAMEDADAVLVRSATRITRDTLVHAKRLRVIGRAGAGVDTIDVDAATERGIAVLTAPSGNTISAAELTLALLLALVRRVAAADASMKSGAWDRSRFTGVELYGKTLGLVGAGRIGSEVARRARAFGMHVVAYDPYLVPERAQALEIELIPLDDVMRRADVITVHVPLTDATAGLIDASELLLLKPTAVLINASRGGVVDESALIAALMEQRLAGAALDVFAEEPLPADHPLRSLDNVVLTPHLGASTAEAQRQVALEIAEAVRAALVEGDLSRAVNAPAIGGEEMRRLRPLLGLAERLGRLAAALGDGAPHVVEVRYAGQLERALPPLAASALIGILAPAVGAAGVNIVNAAHLADARGIAVKQVREAGGVRREYAEYVEVAITRARSESRVSGESGAVGESRVSGESRQAGETRVEGESRVGGALLGEGHPRVVRIGEYRVDVVPSGTLVLLRNRDVPGVIGRVGTVLGDAGVNIGEYHQARHAAGGDALAAISVDGRLGAGVVRALREIPEVMDVREVELER